MLKFASWNVNSLKIRFEQVLAWLQTSEADLLALQETKMMDEVFPAQLFQDHGFHVFFSGQKTYNGVAIISRQPIHDIVTDIPGLTDPQRRILAATVAGIRVINLYVPNGSEVGSEKYAYKLNWLEKVTAFIKAELLVYPRLMVLGDFNIAPDDRDVHDPATWEGCIHVSPLERQAFSALIALGLEDSFRHFDREEKCFSWWDYRMGAFRRNMGLRIDHILLSKDLMTHCTQSEIDVEPRRNPRPSDHAPVWVSLAL